MKLPFFKLARVLGLVAILGFVVFTSVTLVSAAGTVQPGGSCTSYTQCTAGNFCSTLVGQCRACTTQEKTDYPAQCNVSTSTTRPQITLFDSTKSSVAVNESFTLSMTATTQDSAGLDYINICDGGNCPKTFCNGGKTCFANLPVSKSAAGTYSFAAYAKGKNGLAASNDGTTKSVIVSGGGTAPSPTPSANMSCTPRSVLSTTTSIACSGSGSGGSGGYAYKWEYSTQHLKQMSSSSAQRAQFLAQSNINTTTTVTFRVTDSAGKQATDSETITINTTGSGGDGTVGGTAPVATITCNPASLIYSSGAAPSTTCRVTLSPAVATSYRWSVSGPATGTSTSSVIMVTANTSQPSGTIMATATVGYGSNKSVVKSVNIGFTNNAVAGGGGVSGNVSINSLSVGYGGAAGWAIFTYKICPRDSGVRYTIDFGQGRTRTLNGTTCQFLNHNSSGYKDGTYTAKIDATGSNGTTASRTVTFTFSNGATKLTQGGDTSPGGSLNVSVVCTPDKLTYTSGVSVSNSYCYSNVTNLPTSAMVGVYSWQAGDPGKLISGNSSASATVSADKAKPGGNIAVTLNVTASNGATGTGTDTIQFVNNAVTTPPPGGGDQHTLVVTAPTASTTAQADGNLTVSWTGTIVGESTARVIIYQGTPPSSPNQGFSSQGIIKQFSYGSPVPISRQSYTDRLPQSMVAGPYFAAVGVEGKHVAYSPAFQVTASGTDPNPPPVPDPNLTPSPPPGTPPPPPPGNDLAITAPASGAAYKPGDNITISWTGTAPEFSNMYVALYQGTPPTDNKNWPANGKGVFNGSNLIAVSAGTLTEKVNTGLADGEYFVAAGQGTLRIVFSPKFYINQTGTVPGGPPGGPPGTSSEFKFTAPTVGSPFAPGDNMVVSWTGKIEGDIVVKNAYFALYKGSPLTGKRTKWPEADGRPNDGPKFLLNGGQTLDITAQDRFNQVVPDKDKNGQALPDGDDYYLVAGIEGANVASDKFSIRRRIDNPPVPPGSGLNDFHFTAPTLGAPHAPGDTLTVSWAGTIQNVRTAYLALYKGSPLTGLRQKWPEADGRPNDGPHWLLNNSQPVDLIGQSVLTQVIPDTTPTGNRAGLPIEDGDDYYLVTGVPGSGVVASLKFSIRRRVTPPPPGGGNPPGSGVIDFHFTAPTAGSPFAPGDTLTVSWAGTIKDVTDAYIALYKGTPLTGLRQKWPEADGRPNDGPHWVLNNGAAVNIVTTQRLENAIPDVAQKGPRLGLTLEDGDDYYLAAGAEGKGIVTSPKFSIRRRVTPPPPGGGNPPGSGVIDFHFTAPTAGSPFAPGDPITIAWLGQLTGVRDAFIALYKGTPYTSLRTKWPEEDGKTGDGPHHLFNNGQALDIISRDRLIENIPVNATRGLRAGLPLEDSDNYYLVIGDSGKKVAYSERFSIRNRTNTGSNSNPSISHFRVVGNSTRAVNDTIYFEYYVCDANNDPLTLEVNFGDGVVQSVTGQCVANQVSHIYRNTGTYSATLIARDNRSGQSQASATITIQAPPLTQYGLSSGMLVRTPTNDRVYHIMANQTNTKLLKHWLPNANVFLSYGYRWDDIRIVDDSILNSVPRVKVVKLQNNSDLYYLTEGDMKRKIPNDNIFRSYGNIPEDTVTINQTEYNWYPINILIHLDKAPQIYFLENGRKRWIKTDKAFRSRGYAWNMVAIVNQTEFSYYPDGSAIE